MADSCDNCYYVRKLSGVAYCCFRAPDASVLTAWRQLDPINSPYWYGDGADAPTGRSFSSPVNLIPTGPAGPQGPQGPIGLTGTPIKIVHGLGGLGDTGGAF